MAVIFDNVWKTSRAEAADLESTIDRNFASSSNTNEWTVRVRLNLTSAFTCTRVAVIYLWDLKIEIFCVAEQYCDGYPRYKETWSIFDDKWMQYDIQKMNNYDIQIWVYFCLSRYLIIQNFFQ